jgi:transcriptional regulator
MFVPSRYREPDGSWLVDLVRRNPLAQLTSNGSAAEGPHATHVPVILEPRRSDGCPSDLSGATLLGHMNRANPHWQALGAGDTVLLTFTGPHAYVSPAVYRVTPAAPTWNFTAVHVHGALHKIESVEETLDVVESTVEAFEAEFGADWAMTGSLDYFRRIVPGVGAFRITVSRAEGMFKLSQEQQADVRTRVERSFAQRESSHHREIAALMRRLAHRAT